MMMHRNDLDALLEKFSFSAETKAFLVKTYYSHDPEAILMVQSLQDTLDGRRFSSFRYLWLLMKLVWRRGPR